MKCHFHAHFIHLHSNTTLFMKLSKTFISILFLFLFLQIPQCSLPAEATDKKLLQELAARYEEAALGDDMQKELEVLETYLAEAIRQKDLREESYARMQKINCFFNYEEFDKLYAEIPIQAAFFRGQGQWDRYYTVLETEVEALVLPEPYGKRHQESPPYLQRGTEGRPQGRSRHQFLLHRLYLPSHPKRAGGRKIHA